MSGRYVVYRGMQMIEGWPQKIAQAQSIRTCVCAGSRMRRIRWGHEEEEEFDTSRPCPDCGVIKGEYHVPGCDLEVCPNCQGQFIGCECNA